MVSKKKFDEAKKVLFKIAKINKKALPSDEYNFEESVVRADSQFAQAITESYLEDNEYDEYSQMAEALCDNVFSHRKKKIKSQNYSVMDLFRYKSMLKVTLPLIMGYFAIYVSYFGSILALQSLGGNMYLNAIYIDVCELSIYIIASFLYSLFSPCC